MVVERLLSKTGVLSYLRRREDQQRSSDEVEARVDKHMATVVARLERLDNLPRAPVDTGERLEAPSDTERYAYQFSLSSEPTALAALIPPDVEIAE